MLDISPTLAMYEQTDMAFARAYWHWFFLIQKAPIPETMIGADPAFYLRHKMGDGAAGMAPFAPARVGRVRALLHARGHPRQLRGLPRRGRRSTSSTTAPTARRGGASPARCWRCGARTAWSSAASSPLEDWGRVATDVRGRALPAGHYLPEEVPDLVADEFESFFGD